MSEKKEIKNDDLGKIAGGGGKVTPNTHIPKSNNALPLYTCIHCGEKVDTIYAMENNNICPKCKMNIFE